MFWGEKYSYTTGLDQLGIQATSQATYAVLLPGLTNLTGRIRYYGFYCWLLKQYSEKIRNTGKSEFRGFIRKSEYALALIMMHGNRQASQIPGSTFASSRIDDTFGDCYDLESGTDLKAPENYWKNPAGVFGQYYQGAMETIGLVERTEQYELYINSKEIGGKDYVYGELLAEAFESNVGVDNADLFYEAVKNGKLYKKDLDDLYGAFNMMDIPSNSEEKRLYIKLLTSEDRPANENPDKSTWFRKKTIGYLLNYVKELQGNWYDFKKQFYKNKCAREKDDCALGWYYYELNEYWHYACECVLYALLTEMENDNRTIVDLFIQKIRDIILAGLKRERLLNDGSERLEDVVDAISYGNNDICEEENLLEFLAKADSKGFATIGLIQLMALYKNNFNHIAELEVLSVKNNMTRGYDCIEGIRYFERYKNSPVKDFIEKWIYKFIVNRHLEIAYRKMGNGTRQTHKFTIEDGLFNFKEITGPKWTSPRLGSLHNMLVDLGLMDNSEDGRVTSTGLNMINTLK